MRASGDQEGNRDDSSSDAHESRIVARYRKAQRPAAPPSPGLLKFAGLWPILGFGYWAVEERATGRWVGDVGFADFHRDMTPPLGDAPEGGWVLAPWSHGRGYATEAVLATLAWSDVQLPGRAVVCIVNPENEASLRVAKKCGFVESGRGELKGATVVVLRREAR